VNAASARTIRDPLALLLRAGPEFAMLAVAAAVAVDAWPFGVDARALLFGALFLEGATAMFLCTVVDVASRLRRPPPWWAGLLLCAGLLALYPDVLQLVAGLLAEGWWVGLPVALTVGERLREVWTLPAQPPLEKQRRRALTFGRLFTLLVLAGAFMVPWLIESAIAASTHGGEATRVPALLPWYAVAFYALCAWDAIRVHHAAFAVAPSNLWPRFDLGESARLDPL
jgi:hypothetical protein